MHKLSGHQHLHTLHTNKQFHYGTSQQNTNPSPFHAPNTKKTPTELTGHQPSFVQHPHIHAHDIRTPPYTLSGHKHFHAYATRTPTLPSMYTPHIMQNTGLFAHTLSGQQHFHAHAMNTPTIPCTRQQDIKIFHAEHCTAHQHMSSTLHKQLLSCTCHHTHHQDIPPICVSMYHPSKDPHRLRTHTKSTASH